VLIKNLLTVREKLRELRGKDRKLFDAHFDKPLLDVPLYQVAPQDPPPEGVIPLGKDSEKESGEEKNANVILGGKWALVAITPGSGTYQMLNKRVSAL
jgi:hypothetical protein